MRADPTRLPPFRVTTAGFTLGGRAVHGRSKVGAPATACAALAYSVFERPLRRPRSPAHYPGAYASSQARSYAAGSAARHSSNTSKIAACSSRVGVSLSIHAVNSLAPRCEAVRNAEKLVPPPVATARGLRSHHSLASSSVAGTHAEQSNSAPARLAVLGITGGF